MMHGAVGLTAGTASGAARARDGTRGLALSLAAALMAALPAGGLASDDVTYHRDVAPIMIAHCAACHRPGQVAPFPLLAGGSMATRPPGGGGGGPAGDPADSPPRPKWPDGWQLGQPDLVLRMAEAFTVPAEGADVYRNFVLPVPLELRRYVRGFELRPGNPRVVHHSVIQIDRTGSARRLDAGDPGPGFGGMGMGDSAPPDGFFLGWTPGNTPEFVPSGMSWPLDPGSDLVLQLHLVPSGKPEPVQAEIGLFLTDTPPQREPHLLLLFNPNIDIPPGERAYVIEDTYTLPVDVFALSLYPHAHYLGRDMRVDATLPDGGRRTLIHIPDWDLAWQDSYTFAEPPLLPRGTTVVMRYTYDNSAENVRNPNRPPQRVRYGLQSSDEMGTLSLQVLPRDPAELAALRSDARRASLRKNLAAAQAAAARHPDSPALLLSVASRQRALGETAAAAEALERALALDPNHAGVLNELGIVRETQQRYAEAETLLRRVLALEPQNDGAINNLGRVLYAQGRRDEAIARYREALAISPNAFAPNHNLGVALGSAGQVAPAIDHLRRALRASPGDVDTHFYLALALALDGRPDEGRAALESAVALGADVVKARTEFARVRLRQGAAEDALDQVERAVAAQPDNAAGRVMLGRLLLHLKRPADAVPHLREAVRLDPQNAAAMNDLAWLLATHADAALRNGEEALRLALRAVELTGGRQAPALDPLAAAYAPLGRFAEAVTTAEKAIAAATSEPDREKYTSRRDLFRSRTPLRQ